MTIIGVELSFFELLISLMLIIGFMFPKEKEDLMFSSIKLIIGGTLLSLIAPYQIGWGILTVILIFTIFIIGINFYYKEKKR